MKSLAHLHLIGENLGALCKLRNSRFFTGGVSLLLIIPLLSCGDKNSGKGSPEESSDVPAAANMESAHVAKVSGEKTFGLFTTKIPEGWVEQTPSSAMRKAQYLLPRVKGDAADGEMAIFYFPGKGGSVEANLDRWMGQFTQPDGSSTQAKAKISKKQVAGLNVTVLDVSGTYDAGMMPGMAAGAEKAAVKGYRMLGAVVETSEGPWFFKAIGPEPTIAQWAGSFEQLIAAIKMK
jgi:hypothetical protein